jgi:hypothetical protein
MTRGLEDDLKRMDEPRRLVEEVVGGTVYFHFRAPRSKPHLDLE